jgi:hypothetical protein
MLTSLGASSIFMLPQITSNQRYQWVGFYVNLSTLCLKYYDHSTVQLLYYKYGSQYRIEYRSTLSGVGGWVK